MRRYWSKQGLRDFVLKQVVVTVCVSHGMFSATSGTRIPRLCPVIPGIFILFSFLLLLVKEVLLLTSTLLIGASKLADYNHTPKVLQM